MHTQEQVIFLKLTFMKGIIENWEVIYIKEKVARDLNPYHTGNGMACVS